MAISSDATAVRATRETACEAARKTTRELKRGRPSAMARKALASMALATIAACASVPERAPVAAMHDAATLSARAPLAAPPAPWPRTDWWTAYNDPQLTSLVEEGLARAPSLAEAQARVRVAAAARNGAAAAAGPALDANASALAQKQSYNAGIPAAFVPRGYQDFGRATLDFSYEFDFWGRNRAAIAAATSQVEVAAAEAAQARLTLSTSIAAAYADLARFGAERAITEQALQVRTQTVDLVTRRVDNGIDTRGALRQAEAGPPSARAQLAALDEAIAQTRNRMAALLGAGPDRGAAVALPTALALAPFGLPEHLGADLMGRRPDVVAARWRVEAANQRANVAAASFYPNVNLTAFLGVQALGLDSLARAGSDVGSVGPAISLPIFDSGSLGANLQRSDAERDGAIAAYNGALAEALRDVADVTASQRALTVRLAETRTALAADEDAYRITRQRYEGGLAPYQSVLIVEDAVLSQRLVLTDLESRRFALDIALVRALGGGFTTP